MELGMITGLIGVGLSIATFVIGRITAGKTSGKENGQMLSDIGYIKSSVDNLRAEVKEMNKNLSEIRIEQAAQARDIKTLYSRVESLEKRIAHYHEGG